RLLAYPERQSLNITARLRSVEKANLLKNFDGMTVIGPYSDLDKLEAAASTANVCSRYRKTYCISKIECRLIMGRVGSKQRHAETRKQPILIHTVRGTLFLQQVLPLTPIIAIILDNAQGKVASDDPGTPRRNVDMAIVSQQGRIRVHIVVPPAIFGRVTGPLSENGTCISRSIHIPALIQVAWHRKASGLLGEGKNRW
ncbi:hypothetical protein GLOTRDRAFT_29014, partial [Gloeophyllum trabeum ATCC 11539]